MRTFIAVAILLAVAAGTVYTQTSPDLPKLPQPSAPGDLLVPVAPTPPKELTIDQMLDEIERVRVQKAELEKKEKDLVNEVRKRLDKQTERTKRMGILEMPPAVPPIPATVPADSALPGIPLRSVPNVGKSN